MTIPLTDADLSRILASLAAEDNGVFLETTRVTDQEHRSLLFLRPVAELLCCAGDDPHRFFAQIEDFLGQGYYLAGWMAYELGELLEPALAGGRPHAPLTQAAAERVPLARFGVYGEPHICDHRTGRFSGAGPWPQPPPPAAPAPCSVSNLRPSLDQAEYLAAIARIKDYIAAGDTYQVNYTLKLLFDFAGAPESLYQNLRRNQSVSFGACLRSASRWTLSFSPELFFRKEDDLCLVRPMKGTVERGPYREADQRLIEFLSRDEKNRSENVMIVDLLRNDLGRVCRPGTVAVRSLFDVETYETLHQMTSTIAGQLRPDTTIEALFTALFPCGSVTGAPKIRTMEIIRELEPERRGVYTGAIGYLSPAGEAVFNVPIRTIVLENGKGEMGIGSGVVHDSDPVQEWRECLLKGRFLTEPAPAFGLIETILWQPGSGYWLRDEHLARLAESASYFLYPFQAEAIMARLAGLAEGFGGEPMRVRLVLAKDGGLELTAAPGPAHSVWDLPTTPSDDPPPVAFSSQATDPASPHLYHKTTLRDLYDRERQKAVAAGLYEVLFTNTRGEVTEGSISNLFIQKDGALLTPARECGLLNGVFRRYFLTHASLPIREAVFSQSEVAAAEAIYLGNSVRGLVRVRLV